MLTNIDSLTKLKTYILGALGSPVNNIEIDDDQLTNRISDALDLFIEYHYDGLTENIYELAVTKDLHDYVLPDEIKIVLYVFPESSFSTADDPLLMKRPFIVGNDGDVMRHGLSEIEVWRQHYEMVDDYFKKYFRFDYNTASNKLHLLIPPAADGNYGLKVYKSETVANIADIYNSRWFKQYCVALAGLQWAINISKYGGAPLPGGVTLNYSEMEARYTAQKEKLEEDLISMYTEPTDFFVA